MSKDLDNLHDDEDEDEIFEEYDDSSVLASQQASRLLETEDEDEDYYIKPKIVNRRLRNLEDEEDPMAKWDKYKM